MKAPALLKLLEDQQVHSGEYLARALGISRTAVWKQIRKAQADGVAIRTIKGRGYQLLSTVDYLDRDAVLRQLSEEVLSKVDLHVLEEVDSTNREVARRLGLVSQPLPVVMADCQTQGRGRLGRTWASPKGENIYLSVGLALSGGFGALEGLSLVLGVAVARALEALGANPLGLKWPNDLYAFNRKLGGILVEIQGELQEGCVQVIAGIGLNVHMSDAEDVDQPWVSLANAWPEIRWRRSDIAAAMLNEIERAVRIFEQDGFGSFKDSWQARDIFLDMPLKAKDGELQGIGAGIDEKGNYRLQQGDATISVGAGDISLRITP
ncbi:BirA family transcriptional regulator, biotin operon repressor / biotin-[acetyl-CoA-carboxylase] ligase [Marinobacter persicus]|uniref:Bifunctional ligase/repressor BirA n=1 Tax=Marinobacter persicus TaxID=930118 RepID=A0A1I3XES4_9GAMM|nr:biotin--[acetyl-CoA-carboxylase] ligase [Marinobacter persicus]GHD54670.1 bifunctional ligase/repressor BirA [Marinobacter persicus]SFK18034.1 BirA family transcriptional regulator, biotin operon repressor / biotin-[acetyl-CoA-carboxylase] ligase [Marinobacter persicus]